MSGCAIGLFAALSVPSLVICIVAIIAEVASYSTTFGWTSHHNSWTKGSIRWVAATRNHDLVVSEGVLYETGEESQDMRLTGRPVVDEHQVLSPSDLAELGRDQTIYGFSWNDTRRIWGIPAYAYERYWQRSVPLWLFVVLGCIVPSAWLLTFLHTLRQAARSRAGRCRTCGYDLRASRGRCPECGTPIPPVTVA